MLVQRPRGEFKSRSFLPEHSEAHPPDSNAHCKSKEAAAQTAAHLSACQRRSRKLFESTQTELKAMAAAASHGVSRMWKAG
jgi:hypothetical protein